jgi:PD-(D/E)XK endonuclease
VEHPKDIGDRSTLAIMLVLDRLGYDVLTPFGENTRYDLVLDDGVRLMRVQCKTGRLRNGAVLFALCSCYGHHRHPETARRDYRGQVDYFAVYCPETGGVYLVPIADLTARVLGTLRVEPSRNNQAKGVRYAADYEVAASLLKDFARLLVREDLALHALQRVVDRLRVAAEPLGHFLVGRAFEVEAQRVRLE